MLVDQYPPNYLELFEHRATTPRECQTAEGGRRWAAKRAAAARVNNTYTTQLWHLNAFDIYDFEGIQNTNTHNT